MVAIVNTYPSDHRPLNFRERPSGHIAHFTDDRIASKLMAMGVLPGSRIELLRPAPFGGGWYTKVDGLFLALRQEEVASIVLGA